MFEFNLGVFTLSFIVTEVTTQIFPNLRFFIFNGNKKIKIHHAYLGAFLAFLAGSMGQVTLLNIGLGTMSSDILLHIKKKIDKIFKL